MEGPEKVKVNDSRATQGSARLDPTLVANLPPFSRLSPQQIREVVRRAIVRHRSPGSAFYFEGDEAENFFLLLDGYVRVLRVTKDGEQVNVLHVPPGQLFGIAKVLSRTTYPATAEAAAECLALSWPVAIWDEFAHDYPDFLTETYRTVGKRMSEINDQLVAMATMQVEQRVANSLLKLSNQAGREVPEGIEINFPITRQEISEMTGTTLHTVSRLLSAWERSGIVANARKRVVIRRPHDLVNLAEATSTD